jgi:glycosyltransferase involved in cell wall biosynthesis
MVLLSVHLITFNNEKYIEETLQSIIKQKVDFNYEIVVGDDCSTDGTLEIINNYAAKYPNLFKVLKNEKQLGILENFKSTLDRCDGIYIFDIAGDDMLKTTNALQKLIDAFKINENLGFIDSGFDSFIEESKTTIPFKNKFIINSSKDVYKEAVLLGEIIPIGHCYRKEYLYKYVDFKTYLKINVTIEDYPILVDMIMNTEFERINESLHIYRVHRNSHSNNQNIEQQIFQSNQMNDLFNFFSRKYGFSEKLNYKYSNYHYKTLLYYARISNNSEMAKTVYKKIKLKSLKDRLRYLGSQYLFLGKLISLRRKFSSFK